ncbi:ribose-phosphate diphosphokinase [Altererythrobacter sp. KTW20L]|uniref:ribose-phosphate diphosphokinase n=1 Tax=Altererythrobacter sp. KTW20L TaxID=2942210 RepID=UPI0020BEA70A|nr:ribose-phosphate diphosphokinase [Altererythrobacter sp. KTW20L]MCL6250284.1 ribose-phosphate diphosphokinase [Altererythrobacter sp. KTW20L]
MAAIVHYFDECATPALRLAEALGATAGAIEVHRFPDGESRVRVAPSASAAILYRSLDNPNARLVEVLLAASALRDNGAGQVILVAPYLGYMRQDIAFRPGEAVSQRVIGALLADHFDGVLTVDPHLHRIASLGEVMPGIPAVAISACPLLAQSLTGVANPVLVGPDSESRQWVSALADAAGLQFLIGEKQRHGDRAVSIRFDGIEQFAGRNFVLVDDLISSGETLAQAARHLHGAGAATVDAMATHCLAGPDDLARLRAAGIASVRATDTVAGPCADIAIAGLLAETITAYGWAGNEAE